MASLIRQKVTFSASPRELFNFYLDSVLDLPFDRVKNGGCTGSCRSMFLCMPTLISMEGGPSIPGNPGKTM
jgi:hypothetical protein